MNTFAGFLENKFYDDNPSVIKDNIEEKMDRWFSRLDTQEVISYAEEWGSMEYQRGKGDATKKEWTEGFDSDFRSFITTILAEQETKIRGGIKELINIELNKWNNNGVTEALNNITNLL